MIWAWTNGATRRPRGRDALQGLSPKSGGFPERGHNEPKVRALD